MLSLMAKELEKEELAKEMTKEEHLTQQQGSREVAEVEIIEARSSEAVN